MGRFFVAGLTALGVIGFSTSLAAQETPWPLIEDDSIEVQGDRPLSRDEIVRGQRQLFGDDLPYDTAPRFHDPVCVAVVGLYGQQNEMVAERIRRNIREAGVALAEPDCKPNALVSANRKPAKVIDALRKRDPQLFNPDSDRAIARQLAADKPAIVWGETVLRTNDGILLGNRSTANTNPAFAVPVFFGTNPSRHRANLYQAKMNAIVFLDLAQLEDMHVTQLADYATLHLLGNPRDPADYEAAGVPTILSLFADGPRKAPLEMTSLDRAYLRGLYQLRRADLAWNLTASVLRSYTGPAVLEDSGAPATTSSPTSPS